MTLLNSAKINFLDIAVTKKQNNLNFKIYIKPISTDVYYSYIHRLMTLPMSIEDYNDVIKILKHIAVNNGYKSTIIDNLINKHKKKAKIINNPLYNSDLNKKKKFISAEFSNFIPKILNSIVNKYGYTTGYRTNNNIFKILRNNKPAIDKDSTGIYRLNCSKCEKFYLGQTYKSTES